MILFFFVYVMTERNTNNGNLIVAIVIAVIVGVVVYFLIDNKPVGNTGLPTGTGSVIDSGVVNTGVNTGA